MLAIIYVFIVFFFNKNHFYFLKNIHATWYSYTVNTIYEFEFNLIRHLFYMNVKFRAVQMLDYADCTTSPGRLQVKRCASLVASIQVAMLSEIHFHRRNWGANFHWWWWWWATLDHMRCVCKLSAKCRARIRRSEEEYVLVRHYSLSTLSARQPSTFKEISCTVYRSNEGRPASRHICTSAYIYTCFMFTQRDEPYTRYWS